jgi:hypothetical protein
MFYLPKYGYFYEFMLIKVIKTESYVVKTYECEIGDSKYVDIF